MPRYTQARLDYALQVFRDSAPYRNKRGLQAEHLEQHLRKYALRTSTTSLVAERPGLWNDKDDSGDYDPTVTKKRQNEPCPPKARKSKRKIRDIGVDDENKPSAKKAKNSRGWLSGRMQGFTLKITLKLNSPPGKALLESLADKAIGPLDHEGLCDTGEDKPGLWALTGGTFAGTSKSSWSASARRRSMLRPVFEDTGDDEEVNYGGFGLRTRRTSNTNATVSVRKRANIQTSHPCVSAKTNEPKGMIKGNPSNGPGEFENQITIRSPSSEGRDATKWIDTNWAHPMDFKFSAARDPGKICHFCSDYRLSILGYGLKRVEVIVGGDRYIERGGGHREEGKEPTNMCLRCALKRFAIYRCAKHEFVRLSGIREEDFDFQASFDDLGNEDKARRNPVPIHPWCHFCLSPAFHACRARQRYNEIGQPLALEAQAKTGCGILLCTLCLRHVETWGMNRRRLERAIDERCWKVRADMEFLFPGSDLHKAWDVAC